MTFTDHPSRYENQANTSAVNTATKPNKVVSLGKAHRDRHESNVTSLYERTRHRNYSINDETSVYNPVNSYYQSTSDRIQYRVNQFIVTFILGLVGIITAIFGVLISGDLISF